MVAEAELELLRKSNEVQLLELERLRVDLVNEQDDHADDVHELDRLRKENERLTGSLDRWAAERAHLKARLHRIEEAARAIANAVDEEPVSVAHEWQAALRAALEEEEEA